MSAEMRAQIRERNAEAHRRARASWTQEQKDGICVAALDNMKAQADREAHCPQTHCCAWDSSLPAPEANMEPGSCFYDRMRLCDLCL